MRELERYLPSSAEWRRDWESPRLRVVRGLEQQLLSGVGDGGGMFPSHCAEMRRCDARREERERERERGRGAPLQGLVKAPGWNLRTGEEEG